MRFWHLKEHDIAKGQTRRLPIDSSQFACLLLQLHVFGSVTFEHLHDSNVLYSDAAV